MKQKITKLNNDDDYGANVVARSELMLAVTEEIKRRGWTQSQAAEFFGVGQPRISDVAQGRVERFSVDMLMSWLHKLGKDVSVVVRDNVFSNASLVHLVLYVCGTPDQKLLQNVAALFGGDESRFKLEIVDVLQNAQRAAAERISSTPCLVKEQPLPRVVLTGDMSAASVRWQLAVSERTSIENHQTAMDLRHAAQDKRELEQDEREARLKKRTES